MQFSNPFVTPVCTKAFWGSSTGRLPHTDLAEVVPCDRRQTLAECPQHGSRPDQATEGSNKIIHARRLHSFGWKGGFFWRVCEL